MQRPRWLVHHHSREEHGAQGSGEVGDQPEQPRPPTLLTSSLQLTPIQESTQTTGSSSGTSEYPWGPISVQMGRDALSVPLSTEESSFIWGSGAAASTHPLHSLSGSVRLQMSPGRVSVTHSKSIHRAHAPRGEKAESPAYFTPE